MAGEWPPAPISWRAGGENGRRMAGEWPESGWRMAGEWFGVEGGFAKKFDGLWPGSGGIWGGIWRIAALNRRMCNRIVGEWLGTVSACTECA
eukprot:1580987-Alexandrium_andersonii.AAC.1